MKRDRRTFYCFSPPVMIATFVTETVLFAYTLVRYRLTPLGRVICATLACLALFQFAEYHVCGAGMVPAGWSRIGYVAITLLPALGIHLIQLISGRQSRPVLAAAYGSSAAFALAFGLSPSAFQGHVCAGNYAIFQLASPLGGMYFAYYYFWLFAGVGMCWLFARTAQAAVRKALLLQIGGYLSFILPTGIVNALNPRTLAGIPSIMCGFAVLYALVLVFGIVPLILPRRDEHGNSQRMATGH